MIGLGVGLGVGLFVLVAIVAVVILLLKRKRKVGGKPANVETLEVLAKHPIRLKRPVKISQLLDFLNERRTNKSLYSEEFNSLPPATIPRIKSCSYAEKFHSKNRFPDILPYNEGRVHLKNPSMDYINASFIDGYDRTKVYIATQGPLNSTCGDFWHMVWEQNATKIIMVANLIEDGMSKCAQYFPMLQSNGEQPAPMTFDIFVISLSSEKEHPDYIVRTFEVLKEKGERRTVRQFHYTRWPDRGVPESSSSIIKFHQACFADEEYSTPIVIHCSAGVGRTGTLLAIDILLAQAKSEGQIDVPFCVDQLRRNRSVMVQTLAQYLYVHFTVAEVLLVGDVSIPRPSFTKYLSTLDDPKICNKSNLQLQFELLQVSKPVFTEQNYTQGLSNKHLNRFSQILPVDEFIAYLNSDEKEIYINAVFVNSHKTKNKFIVTHAPLLSNVDNFWELVLFYDCHAIFMLSDAIPDEDNYCPKSGCSKAFGKFVVSNKREIEGDGIVSSQLKISNMFHGQNDVVEKRPELKYSGSNYSGLNSEGTEVKHIRISNWPEGDIHSNGMQALLPAVNKACNHNDKNPEDTLMVHCRNGAERSGLFCALFCIIEKMTITGEVDLFNSVKKIHKTRPEFINSVEHLRKLYQLVNLYLSERQRSSCHDNL